MKIAVLLLVLSCATAQAETFRNANGQVTGRSVTNNAGTTFYDANGRNTGRSTTNSTGTTFYDNMGRVQGRVTK